MRCSPLAIYPLTLEGQLPDAERAAQTKRAGTKRRSDARSLIASQTAEQEVGARIVGGSALSGSRYIITHHASFWQPLGER